MASTSRFGNENEFNIKNLINKSVPLNTKRTKKSVWNQFEEFCKIRGYFLREDTTIDQLASIIKGYAANMKKTNVEDY